MVRKANAGDGVKQMTGKIRLALVISLSLVLSLSVLVASGPAAHAANSDTYEQLNLFGDVFERIRNNHVVEAEDKELIEAAINGMLSSLDPHSSFLNAESYRDMQVQTRGEFGGLGIEVTMENGLIKVVAPIDDTPAARAGLLGLTCLTLAGLFTLNTKGEGITRTAKRLWKAPEKEKA